MKERVAPMGEEADGGGPLRVGRAPLRIEDVIAVAEGRLRVALDPDPGYRAQLAQGVAAVERALAEGRPIYGVSTGVGASVDNAIEGSLRDQLPRNVVRFHGCGTGRHPGRDGGRRRRDRAARLAGARLLRRAAAAARAPLRFPEPASAAADPRGGLGGRQRRSHAALVSGGGAAGRARGQPARRAARRGRRRTSAPASSRSSWSARRASRS